MAGWNKDKTESFKRRFQAFLKHVHIASKESEGYRPIRLYGAQRRFLNEVFDGLKNDIHFFVVLKARQLGLCVSPESRVLTADLRWVPIETVRVGDELVSCDEMPEKRSGRDMRTCIVEQTREVFEPAIEMIMDDGSKLVATADHRFLFKKRGAVDTKWAKVKNAKIGDEIKYVVSPWEPGGMDDAWMGGLVDGEGCLRQKDRAGVELSVSQVSGDVLDRARSYLHQHGYAFREEIDNRKGGESSKLGNKPVHKLVIGRMAELFRFLGQCRPTRLSKSRWWEGKSLPGRRIGNGWRKVVSIRLLPSQRMIDLQTSTKTFLCEGFVSHNSTIVRILILFWAFVHRGLRVALVYDTGEHRDEARNEIRQIIERLPQAHKIGVRVNSRAMIELENGSRISFLVAGSKKTATSGGLGRSLGINCAGCTEVSSWGDVEGVRALERSLAQKFENRLYIWESTARGFNIFYHVWEEAKADDLAKRAVFIGWWSKEDYALEKGTALYERYAAPPITEEEAEKIRLVKERYGHDISMEQLAWFRHEFNPDKDDGREHIGQDIIQQELPWHEEEAWLLTGSQFFPTEKLTDQTKEAARMTFKGYRYFMTEEFLATLIEPVKIPRQAHLKVWEEPDPAGVYVMGADPAFGSGENADRYAVQVLRCFADGVDQVAEFCTPHLTTYQFAWVLMHLAGAYVNCRFLLELNGPGNAVWNEFRVMRQNLEKGYLRQAAREQGFDNVFSSVREYIYAKADTLQRSPSAFHWETNAKRKGEIMERLKDYVHNGRIRIRSMECLEEMKTIVRDGDSIAADGNNKDDRVIALALALRCFDDPVTGERKRLMSQGRTREIEAKNREFSPIDLQKMFSDSIVGDFFTRQKRDMLQQLRQARRGNRWTF